MLLLGVASEITCTRYFEICHPELVIRGEGVELKVIVGIFVCTLELRVPAGEGVELGVITGVLA